MDIREAGITDADVVVALIQELAENTGYASSLDRETAAVYLATPGSGVLLAEEEGQAIGMLSYSIRPNLYHAAPSYLVEELVVRESARGGGVGSALLRAALERARAARCVEVSISAMAENTRAIALYKRMGFSDDAVFLEQHLEW